MSEIVTVGLDLAKNVFQAHGAEASGQAVLRRKLRGDAVATTEDPEGEHPLLRHGRSAAAADRSIALGSGLEGEGEWSEADQKTVRWTVFPPNAQAWWPQTARLAQAAP
jgi:hypothetical protein